MKIFEGLKVIELASVLAGPSVGQFFAEGGAQVLKIENTTAGGDVTRSWKLPNEDKNSTISAYFSAANWGKVSLSLDLTQSSERKQFYSLLPQTDIVIASYKWGDAAKLGVDYDTLSKLNPALIYGTIAGYTLEKEKVGYDAIIQAEAGFLYMNGEADTIERKGKSVKMPVALVDILAAHQLKEGILAALWRREKIKNNNLSQEKLGTKVEVSLFDAAVSSLANQATNWLNAGHIPQRLGNQHPNIVPYGSTFETADGSEVIIAVGTDKQFSNLCEVLGLAELPHQEAFKTNPKRVENRQLLLPILEKAFLRYEKKFLIESLEAKNVPVGGVNAMPEVMQKAAHLILEVPQNQNLNLRGVRNFIARFEGNYLDVSDLKPPPFLAQSQK
ncbi:CaiB/BaiF CoA transferase family protein [Hugenholtzia roseola]|uniref:CaiB/BaiF CoA transferase family protein n=1 Tax=Hugenholtzia roseola TaxID=1002 RepID=UPI0004065A20|nr:CaiB/BaiF CoA-transferase family protein [Hugenholtzia roseola]